MSGLGNASALVFDKVRETSAASTKYFDIQHEKSQTKRKTRENRSTNNWNSINPQAVGWKLVPFILSNFLDDILQPRSIKMFAM